jgi:hypothetical protein
MIYEKCRDILLRECEVLREAAVIQEKLRMAVINREFDGFEDHINAMNEIERNITVLENEREQLFTLFEALIRQSYFTDTKDDKGRFYAMVCHLPEAQRNELTGIYRGLKMETLKLRVANEAFMVYLTGIKSTFKEFFDLVFPDRALKMYASNGMHLSNDMRSMVLNQSF